ncbi:MAG: tetratricopeptide repeat protein [bacterium]
MRKSDFIVLMLLSVFVFADTFRVPFIWDDAGQIEKDMFIRNADISVFLKPSYWKGYRTTISPVQIPLKPVSPMRTLSYMLDYKLWGLNPAGFHLTNITLHVLNVLLVYLLCWAIFKDRKICLFAGLFFAVHPMHVETVAWIKNRLDMFASVFYLSALILFVRHADRDVDGGIRSPRGAAMLGGSVLCYVLALLSKEMAVTLPAILLLYVFCFRADGLRKPDMRPMKRTIPFWLITFFYFWFQFYYVKAGELAGQMAGMISFYSHALIVFKTVAYYLKLLVLPFWFCVERFLSVPESIFEPTVLISLAGIIFCGLLIYLFLQNREKGLVFSLAFMVLTILPVSNVIYLASRPIAEHRLYIPSIGLCILIGLLISKITLKEMFKHANKLVYACALLLVTGYSFASMKRNHDWLSPIRLWEATLKTSPDNFRTHYNLAGAYLSAGRDEDALIQFEKALEIMPDDPLLRNSLGVVHFSHDRFKEAISEFEKAVRIYPMFDNAHTNLGWAHYKMGEKEKALRHIRKAIEINSDFGLPHFQLAKIYEDEGKIDEAVKEHRIACEIYLYDWNFHKELIAVLEKQERFDEAIGEYRKAIGLNPHSVGAHNNLGVVYVQKKMYGKAKKEFERVMELDSVNSLGLENLANVERILSRPDKN